jgi:hypothetical protein
MHTVMRIVGMIILLTMNKKKCIIMIIVNKMRMMAMMTPQVSLITIVIFLSTPIVLFKILISVMMMIMVMVIIVRIYHR